MNFELKLASLPLPRVVGKKPVLSTYVSRRKVPSLRACFMPFSVSYQGGVEWVGWRLCGED